MKFFASVIAASFGLIAVSAQPAEAGTRIRCVCANGKAKSWIHHNRACEIHFKKPHTKLSKPKNPSDACSHQEWAQFRTYLCVTAGCTYPYVKASADAVPVTAP
jgi:hypothetical protein